MAYTHSTSCNITEPNVGLVNVPDLKLETLREISQSEELLPASVSSVMAV